jgi:hypothetical protein
MRFVADENVPRATVSALVAYGHEVVWIRQASPGAPDAEVFALAAHEKAVLLTFDKDFGEHGRQVELPSSCGVILVRAPMRGPEDAIRLARLLNDRSDWAGYFSVVEPGRVRMRPMTETPGG